MKAPSLLLSGLTAMAALVGLFASVSHAEDSPAALDTLQKNEPLMALVVRQSAERCGVKPAAISQHWIEQIIASPDAAKAEQALREDKPDVYQKALSSITCPAS